MMVQPCMKMLRLTRFQLKVQVEGIAQVHQIIHKFMEKLTVSDLKIKSFMAENKWIKQTITELLKKWLQNVSMVSSLFMRIIEETKKKIRHKLSYLFFTH